jgi:hypothetical protein
LRAGGDRVAKGAPLAFPVESLGSTDRTAAAFDDDPDGGSMSVVVATSGRDPAEIVARHEGFGLVIRPSEAYPSADPR